MSTKDPLLFIDNITQSFGAVQAIKGITFTIHRGETVTLVGDNGAGKSTLVKIISGLQAPTSSNLIFKGAPHAFRNPADAQASP